MVVAATIARRGSIREASAVLHLTQPAMSRSLAEVERILGVRLFDRGPKGMTVTAAGAPLITPMQLIASEVGSLLRHAEEIVGGRRRCASRSKPPSFGEAVEHPALSLIHI